MQIDELEQFWDFERKLQEDDEIQCQECKEWSSYLDWREGEVGCEDCGSHAAIICPKCEEYFDHVWGESFKVRLRL